MFCNQEVIYLQKLFSEIIKLDVNFLTLLKAKFFAILLRVLSWFSFFSMIVNIQSRIYCLHGLSSSSRICYPWTIDCPTKSRYHFRWKPFARYKALEKGVRDINQVTKKSCTNVHVTSPLRIHVKYLQTVPMPNEGSHTLCRTSDQIM